MNLTTKIFSYCAISIISLSCGNRDNTEEKNAGTTAQIDTVNTPEAFVLQKGRLSSSLQIPGELMAFQQVDLYAKENSFVKKLYVDIGSEVKEGQLLVTMEAPELSSQLEGALSNIKSREAVYTASKSNYDRLLSTSETPGTVSPNDLEQAAARKNADLAQLESAKASYRQIQQTQNYLQIRAPFSGVITARNINPGAYVGPSGRGSETPLFTLQEQKKLRLVVSVPEAYTSYLSNKSAINFIVHAFPNEKFTATVARMAGSVDNRLHSQRIEMDVMNSSKKLLPGMVAEVNVALPSNDSTFVVPVKAVVNSQESVFVIRVSGGKAVWVPIKTGRSADGNMEVYGNLQTGDTLLKMATDEVRNGSTVAKVKL